MKWIFFVLTLAAPLFTKAQSLEVMVGNRNAVVDIQWLKFLDNDKNWSLFSRTLGSVDYENQTNLFTGAYLNYTTGSGFGLSAIGKMAATGAGGDAGVHFFHANEQLLIFALAAMEVKEELQYYWFSILRFTPHLSDRWKLYTSLELFTRFNNLGHSFSTQRIRLGLDKSGLQFGLGLDLSANTSDYSMLPSNTGVFIRKSF